MAHMQLMDLSQSAQVTKLNSLADFVSENVPQWLNVVGMPTDDVLRPFLRSLDVHRLTIDNILDPEQRAKTDYFEDYIFFTARLTCNSENEAKYSFLLLENLLISFQSSHNQFEDISAKFPGKKSTKQLTCDYLFYLLLDNLVGNEMDHIEKLDDEADELEQNYLEKQKYFSLDNIYHAKRLVMQARRKVVPLRDCLMQLLKSGDEYILENNMVYFRDVYEQAARANDAIDGLKEMLNTLLEIFLSSVNNKMNQTMKVLTVFAAIFIPLSFIASLYGMNFEYMPELKWHYGYFVTLGGMATLAIGLFVWFKCKKWI